MTIDPRTCAGLFVWRENEGRRTVPGCTWTVRLRQFGFQPVELRVQFGTALAFDDGAVEHLADDG